ncbi:hypothetical protein CsSME_00048688 [Camellia sinensis var. sinensis]
MAHLYPSDYDGLPQPTTSTVVAIDKDKNSPYAVRWAIEHLLTANSNLILIHVTSRSPDTGVNDSSAPDANGGIADSDLQQIFNPFRVYCARKRVTPKEVVIEDSDVSKALLSYINNNFIANVVLGASTRNALARKFKNYDVPTLLNKHSPDFCSVHVIAKGKAVSIRPASRPAANSATPPRLPSPRGFPLQLPLPHELSELEDRGRQNRAQSLRGLERLMRTKNNSANLSLDIDILTRGPKNSINRNMIGDDGDFQAPGNNGSLDMTAQNLDFNNMAEVRQDNGPQSYSKDMEAEMNRLKLELKQTMDMYNTACKEAVSAKKKVAALLLHDILYYKYCN